jgi:hypothetical protein
VTDAGSRLYAGVIAEALAARVAERIGERIAALERREAAAQ